MKNIDTSWIITSGRRRIGLVLACTALLLVPTMARAQRGATSGEVEDVRAALGKWVETRRLIAERKSEWRLGREVLRDRIAVLGSEIEDLRARIAGTDASIGEAETKRGALVRTNDELKAMARGLGGTVESAEARTLTLLGRLPQPLAEKVAPLARRIPAPGDETSLSLGERFQNVIGVLNEVNGFQREITVVSELRDLGGDQRAEVSVMYIGLAQAYYVSADGRFAGSGRPGVHGWVWHRDDGIAGQVSEALAILRNETPARFVRLPVVIEKDGDK